MWGRRIIKFLKTKETTEVKKKIIIIMPKQKIFGNSLVEEFHCKIQQILSPF